MATQQGEILVQDLAEHFGVSDMTIRRDLAALEDAGELHRTYGGAVLSSAGVVEFAFKSRERLHAQQKKAIAACAVEHINPGMTISLDTGTTTMEVARAIGGIKDLRVLTCSLPVASILYANPNIELVLLGGTVRPGNPDMSGWLTETNLQQFRVDFALLGADAADPDGIYTIDTNVARVSQCMAFGAASTMLVLDHSKFDHTAFVRYAKWEDINIVITDSGTDTNSRKWLKKTGRTIIYAEIS